MKEEFKKYISGFFDGDGSIIVEKLKGSGYTLRIKFCQSNENWIKTVQRIYPYMHYDGGVRRDNHKCEYQLRAAGKQIEPLVDDLLEYSILKYEQLLEAKKFFELINVKNKNNEKEQIYLKLKQLKKNSVLKPYDRLSKEYIAGLFDAEGSIGVYSNSLRVKITQKSDIHILQKIADLYNNTNSIDNYAISFYGVNAFDILNDILPYCIYKKSQIHAAIDYIHLLNVELTDEIKSKREEYIKIISNEKHTDIDIGNYFFKNQESHKVYLRNCFEAFSKLSYKDVLNYCKMKEIEETKVFDKFENKIYNTDNWSIFNINPVLEFCETNNQLQIYQYYRKKVSSLPVTGVIGRAIRILVKDTITDKYIGIICLSSDVYNLGERDTYIKTTSKELDWKNKYLKNIMNLSCCVPLQPFGFNTNGGKLLASLAFSKEVFDYYSFKYKEPLLAIITTSINGKSIQYDRLSCLKMIGYTKGYGSVNIPDNLYKVCQEYNNIWKVIPKSNRIDRFNFLKNLLGHLELSQNILQHNNKRGIYFGYLFSTKLNDNFKQDELKTIHEIYDEWKTRWCNKRIINVLNRNCIKTSFDLYTNDTFKNCVVFELPTIKDKIITDNLIKEILSYKLQPYSQSDVCHILNKKYNISLVQSDIARVYSGNIKPDIIDDEYLNLVSVKISKKKLTDEQIYFILNMYNKSEYNSYSEITSQFNKKFGKQITTGKGIITKGTVSDIVSGKIKPNIPLPILISKPIDKCKLLSDKLSMLSDNQIYMIIKMKDENKTTQEVSDYIKANFNIYINRNFISKLWNGEIKELPNEIIQSDEYINMINNTKKRTIKNKKFTKEEIDWILSVNKDKSLKERIDLFNEKFNKTMTKAYLSKLTK